MHRLNSIDSQPSQREVGCCPTSSPEQHPIWGWIKSHQVFIQAIIVWMLMCLPYNIVTLVLYGKVTSSGSDLATDNITTSRELTVTVYLNLCFNFFYWISNRTKKRKSRETFVGYWIKTPIVWMLPYTLLMIWVHAWKSFKIILNGVQVAIKALFPLSVSSSIFNWTWKLWLADASTTCHQWVE